MSVSAKDKQRKSSKKYISADLHALTLCLHLTYTYIDTSDWKQTTDWLCIISKAGDTSFYK